MSAPDDWTAAPCGLLVLDPAGTVVRVNDQLLAWAGRPAADVVDRVRFGDLLSVGGRLYWETHLAPRLQLEGRLQEISVELRSPDGRVPVLLSAAVVPGSGHVRVALHGARDRVRFERELRAAREQAQHAVDRLSTLQAVTWGLSRATGVREVVEAVLTAATGPLGAATAAVWTSVEGHLQLHSARGEGPVPAPSAPDLAAGPAPRSADGRFEVPLPGAAGFPGVLVLAGVDPVPDTDVLAAVAQQAGLALDRARLHEQSAGVAHALQHAMLAVHPPVDPRYAVGATYRAGVEMLEVGGDWYDVFLVGPGTLGVVVGDVVGRGLVAASAMGQLRSAVRAVSEPGAGPATALTRLDRFVEQVPTAQMATVAYAELDLATGVLRYACAGHPPPLLLPADGPDHYLWGGRSTPLGAVVEGVPRTGTSLQLRAGDRVLLYTDGLVERRDRGLDEGMAALALAAEQVRGRSLGDTTEAVTAVMLQGEVVSDDVCALLLRWSGPPQQGGVAASG
ncbi:Serine phosphatase RsbU, regulator of sigma subunit [Klenkia soli]|uniref:Serine phosphatase RsbU, regulator of sigma subunit n=1 Tax=Klenkia soli TaxID=1052260 RepID=A0A1H0GMI0_9ACTN|nr:SpoIIE family protein phosphatase [Klenkia soli]SDO07982.1 Serine phosphatase RsbU, regulator of sigma subunit [Klenkia soli]